MSTSDSCKDGASKSNEDDVCEVNNKLHNMSTDDNTVSVCANCGEGDDVNNIYNKCKVVKYCNATCKKKHKKKHKKQCEEQVRLAAEHAAKLHDIELFKQPPPLEDCPICFLQLPCLGSGSKYYACCGKLICSGCSYAPVYDNQGNEVDSEKCPFCRIPTPHTDEENIKRYKVRMEAGDAEAIYNMGCYFYNGRYGFQQDYTKALELWHRAGELGYAASYCNTGYFYHTGTGVELDKRKAIHYYELAAIGGDGSARYNLGNMEENAGNLDRAVKHYLIAVGCGHVKSLNMIQKLCKNGNVTKDDYTKALRARQAYLGEIKSPHRDKAADTSEEYRYY